MKQVVIATDISSDDKAQTSAWACYITHEGGIIKRSGEFSDYQPCAARAETYGLINALTIAKSNIPDWDKSVVTIYSEIEYVLNPILTKAGNVKLRDKERTDAIRNIAIPILQQAVDWERKKIKAHFKDWNNSHRKEIYEMNRWCDTESRRVMKTMRKQKKALAL